MLIKPWCGKVPVLTIAPATEASTTNRCYHIITTNQTIIGHILAILLDYSRIECLDLIFTTKISRWFIITITT